MSNRYISFIHSSPPWGGVILPIMFHKAQCWASILYSSTRLAELDSVLACDVLMAFRFERTASVKASLVLTGIEPARYHISWLLVHYLLERHKEALVVSFSDPIHRRRVTPFSWVRHSSRGWSGGGRYLTPFWFISSTSMERLTGPSGQSGASDGADQRLSVMRRMVASGSTDEQTPTGKREPNYNHENYNDSRHHNHIYNTSIIINACLTASQIM